MLDAGNSYRDDPQRRPAAEVPSPGTATTRRGGASAVTPAARELAYRDMRASVTASLRRLDPSPANPGQPPPTEPEDPAVRTALEKAGVDLATLSADDVRQVVASAKTLRDSDVPEKIDAVATIAGVLPVESLTRVAEALGVKSNAVLKLATDADALKAVATLAKSDASATDKVAAALTLTASIGGSAPKALQAKLKPALDALPGGAKLVEAIGTWLDPESSGLDKAGAALEMARAAQDMTGAAFPKLAQRLRAADSLTSSFGAALTLIDPAASPADKAEAVAQLAANLPDIKADAGKLLALFEREGVTGAGNAVGTGLRALPCDALPESVKAALDPGLASRLDAAQVAELKALAADEKLAPALTETLSHLKGADGLSSLLETLGDGAVDNATKKTVLDTLAGMKDGVADQLLASRVDDKPAVQALAGFAATLDADGQAKLAKLMKDFDGDAAKFLLRIAGDGGADALRQVLKVAGEIDSKTVGGFLSMLDKALKKTGVDVSADVAIKLARGLAKVIPVVGAIPAAWSVVDNAKIAADTSLPPDIRLLAAKAGGLNAGDAVWSILEPALSVGAAGVTFEAGGIGGVAPIAVDVGLAAAEVALDVIIGDQKERFEADPANYRPPELLVALNVAIGVTQGPQGIAELAYYYGANGLVDRVGQLSRDGGRGAVIAAEATAMFDADMLRAAAGGTAKGLHLLADIVRHPDKYGDAAERLGERAVERLAELSKGAGALAEAAGSALKNLATDLARAGEAGAKALGWIAAHPSEASEAAARALGQMAAEGVRLGTRVGGRLVSAAMGALAQAREALGAAGDVAGDLVEAVSNAERHAVDAAVAAGRRGIETLSWIARNPGPAAQVARDALVDVASGAGECAVQAYDAIIGLGSQGVELGKRVLHRLQDAGEAGVEVLEYAASHPGEVSDELRAEAGRILAHLAKRGGEIADRSIDALLRLVDNGAHEIHDTVAELLAESESAATRAAEHWKDAAGESVREVAGGLEDLGAAGDGALRKLAGSGVGAARSLVQDLWHLASR